MRIIAKIGSPRSLLALLLTAFVLGCSGNSNTVPNELERSQASAACQISFVDDDYHPKFTVNERALAVPIQSGDKYERAYFSMGCFWGSEALMACPNGVVATRVGFTGGSLENPTYSAIGDHVETVEVVYDPTRTDLPTLLRHFWANHNSRAKPIFRQYASAVFCEDKESIMTARALREEWQKLSGEKKILTAIKPLEKFYPASDSHQKYYLQQDPVLFESLPDQDSKLHTVLAAKLNAVSGRGGQRQDLDTTLKELGIDKDAREILFKRAVWPGT